MAGNPVYGKGYHDGSTDTRQQDLLIAGALLAGAALVKVSMIGYAKLRQTQAARFEKRMLASAQDIDSDASDENNLDSS
ncbi:hypothetical protein [Arthrobacter oryzae]|uniref:hypothetical protein n=1 Tax=Arthrobacter oryzae TaxID=409290 RepID=UPI00273C6A79|nr:hypothetical protein [Arthrobacter oryzae]WLQ05063.1 hypothetical protein Q8Z05_12990 [Arthrobacter oryzae]